MSAADPLPLQIIAIRAFAAKTDSGKEAVMNELVSFWKDEDGVAVVEIVLILVVLIALVLLFKDKITSVLKTILQKVQTQSNQV